jgi:ornithine cyclodeaminase
MNLPYIDAPGVHAALPWPRLIDALAEAFAAGAEAPLRSSHAVTPAGDRLLVMPAWRPGGDLGVKVVTVYPGNAARGVASVAALYLLLDGATGHPRAVIDGEALTLRRTAAASALASRLLSRPDARTLLVVGTGALAPRMAEAHCAVRAIERVLVWGRDASRAAATAAALRATGLRAEPADALEPAVRAADIVTCATTAREPLVHGAWVRPGTHVDLVGAFTPEMRECDDALVARARVYVDTYAGALGEAGELVQAIADGRVGRDHVIAELAELVRGERPGRRDAAEVTLFKSVGTALEDLCAAGLVAAATLPART